ncbi:MULTISPECIES: FliA/WhiG family RNA polymerase sigma factor [Citrobacter]|uniref:FliA/WhiG family RNA polymerase sigma factor n=1 Tax=Citrobacter TaxID=544 RepID=UPI0005A68AC3|nr:MULTISPECIES: FliA/WhiG family RNA polymerase sigma factor [Citrobacter]EHG7580637.1 FliA/WhiG family RNA polymerase sigma factor [Citrobacter sedlakii]EIQ7160251.1 FliA/WhiG family RNA polymerase sigma factor [Citrobacter sedlakii]KSY25898.1 flagellar biosynthesis sigma factor [Citrobacter sp. 50677481]MBM9568976.1 FliA/WhiG family RNA polymerase sigma factor [Citrobacter sedlakii]MBN6597376.1 FliA/WhiG family RNA polymerase sigma factor [Citrobacter sedlakii]
MDMMDFIASETLTPADEARYLSQYLPLVNKIVKQLAYQASSVLDREDMEQSALMGLLSSLRRYGHPDEQFAAYAAPRIRGAVLDELRQLDWRPRRLRQKTHKINDAIREVARLLGRPPTFDDLSRHLSITADEYQEYLLLDCAKALESLDDLLSNDVHAGALDSRPLEEEMIVSRTLRNALASLDEREQLILTLYYQQEMSLKEIALVLDLTEARVCQLNKKIAQKIQSFFQK